VILKNIEVMSRNFAKMFKTDKPWAAISVSTRPEDFAVLSDVNRVDLLQLSFWDIANPESSDISDLRRKNCFKKEQARQILDFVKRNESKIEILLVHCEAGASRSPGIAAAISKILWNDDEMYFKKYMPNGFVYKMILEEHFGTMVKVPEVQEKIYDSIDCLE
jgi:predicted protein tyrosine phosphatase